MTRLSTSGSTSSCEYLHSLQRFVTRFPPTERVPNDSLLQRRHFRNGGISNMALSTQGRRCLPTKYFKTTFAWRFSKAIRPTQYIRYAEAETLTSQDRNAGTSTTTHQGFGEEEKLSAKWGR